MIADSGRLNFEIFTASTFFAKSRFSRPFSKILNSIPSSFKAVRIEQFPKRERNLFFASQQTTKRAPSPKIFENASKARIYLTSS